jgi:hypothetical protein
MSTKPFRKFVQEPSPQDYLRLRRKVMQSRRYDPHARALGELQRELETGEPEEVLRHGRHLDAAFRLSPRYHYLLGQASLASRQWDQVVAHRQASRACLSAILATGQGTARSPHTITYLTDQNDVALALGLNVRCRGLVQTAPRLLDVVTLHDGHELWFDVTDLLAPQYEMAAFSAASNV